MRARTRGRPRCELSGRGPCLSTDRRAAHLCSYLDLPFGAVPIRLVRPTPSDSSPSDPSFLLNERRLISVQVGALNIGLSRQNGNILPERLLFDPRSQAFGGVVPRHLERQPLTRKAPSTATIWKPRRLDHSSSRPVGPSENIAFRTPAPCRRGAVRNRNRSRRHSG
jgi:hypothetical protein